MVLIWWLHVKLHRNRYVFALCIHSYTKKNNRVNLYNFKLQPECSVNTVIFHYKKQSLYIDLLEYFLWWYYKAFVIRVGIYIYINQIALCRTTKLSGLSQSEYHKNGMVLIWLATDSNDTLSFYLDYTWIYCLIHGRGVILREFDDKICCIV